MANDLVLIETRIHEGDAMLGKADIYGQKSVEMKIAAGKTYAEARQMCFQAGRIWNEDLAAYTTRKRSQVYAVMKIAAASDPYAEEAKQRERNDPRNRPGTASGAPDEVPENSVELDPFLPPSTELAPRELLNRMAALRLQLSTVEVIEDTKAALLYCTQLGILDQVLPAADPWAPIVVEPVISEQKVPTEPAAIIAFLASRGGAVMTKATMGLVARVRDCSSKRAFIMQRFADGSAPSWSAQARGVHTQIVDDFYALTEVEQKDVVRLLKKDEVA